jgi:cold shock CspA family protein
VHGKRALAKGPAPFFSGESMTGKIIRWVDEKGFGFIRSDGGSADLFVHVNDFNRVLPEEQLRLQFGDAVEFDMKQTERGPRAVRVRLLEPA